MSDAVLKLTNTSRELEEIGPDFPLAVQTGKLPTTGIPKSMAVADSVIGLADDHTVPTGATQAVIQVETANVRYTLDGATDPSPASASQLGYIGYASGTIVLANATEITNFQVIREGAVSAVLQVQYHK